MKRNFIGIFSILVLAILFAGAAHAVKEFKVSNYGGGSQIWFEAEAFDARDSDKAYKLAKKEAGAAVPAGVSGDAITNMAGSDACWLRYDFDISKAGGKAGTWYFWGRVINPSNQSDFLWVLGHDGKEVPAAKPGDLTTDDDRIFEEDTPAWDWVRKGSPEGHKKNLSAGKNTMVIFWRQSNNTDLFDVFMWADKADYTPTDADYTNAKVPGLAAVKPIHKLSMTWGSIKMR